MTFRRYFKMTAIKKTTKTQAKKTEKKAESRFHTIRSLHKTGENWIETVKGYNEKYITKPFENSKDFVVDMKNDPKKTFEDLFDDGKGFVQDLKKDPKKVWKDLADGSKNLTGDVGKSFLKAVDSVRDSGKDFYAGLGKDAQNILEKGLSKSLESIPDRLNLPSKKDMEKLSKTVRTLNAKLNTLSKQCSA